jgi:hypothetical protein
MTIREQGGRVEDLRGMGMPPITGSGTVRSRCTLAKLGTLPGRHASPHPRLLVPSIGGGPALVDDRAAGTHGLRLGDDLADVDTRATLREEPGRTDTSTRSAAMPSRSAKESLEHFDARRTVAAADSRGTVQREPGRSSVRLRRRRSLLGSVAGDRMRCLRRRCEALPQRSRVGGRYRHHLRLLTPMCWAPRPPAAVLARFWRMVR